MTAEAAPTAFTTAETQVSGYVAQLGLTREILVSLLTAVDELTEQGDNPANTALVDYLRRREQLESIAAGLAYHAVDVLVSRNIQTI